jgi:hypothetical protein
LRGSKLWLALLLAGACLPDLEEARSCPADAARPLGDCSGVVIDYPIVGCIAPEQVTCVNGGRVDCACQSDECPANEDDCHPDGDCPPLVLDDTGQPNAVCRQIPRQAMGVPEIDPINYCTCGCADCMTVCDGRGPFFAVRNRQGLPTPLPIPLMQIGDLLPDGGSFGVYVRARGAGILGIGAFTGSPDDLASLTPISDGNFMTLEPRDTFSERVFYRDVEDAVYAWTDPMLKPTLLLLTGIAPEPDGPSPVSDLLVEIDCVVPFYVPAEGS